MNLILAFRNYITILICTGALVLLSAESSKSPPIPNYYKKYTLSLGSDNAPIKIEKVFSFLCPSCLLFHQHHFPQIKKDFIDTGKVQWTYVPYMMDYETLYVMGVLHACSDTLKTKLFEHLLNEAKNWTNDNNKAAVIDALKCAGIPEVTIQRSLVKKQQDAVRKDGDNFKTLRFIDGTPTFFMNGEEIPGIPSASKLSKLIQTQLKKQRKS